MCTCMCVYIYILYVYKQLKYIAPVPSLAKIYTMFLVYNVKAIEQHEELLSIFRPVMTTVISFFTGKCC